MATVPDLDRYLTPELRQKREEMLKARRLTSLGFYEQLMAYPELFERIEALGSLVRFQSALPRSVYEAEVLMIAVELKSAMEWDTHEKSSLEAGVTPEEREAIATGAELTGDLRFVRDAVRCVVNQQNVPQPLFDTLIQRFGIRGAIEAVALAAIYRMYAALGAGFSRSAG